MNKTNKYLVATAMASALFVAMPMLSNAQTLMDTNAAVNISTEVDAGPGGHPPAGMTAALRAKLEKAQSGYQAQLDKAEGNANYRNNMMKSSTTFEGKVRLPMASTTRPMPPRFEDRNDHREASTTIRAEIKEDRKDMREARRDMFENMKKHIVEQVTQALDNLKQIRSRISARIDTATQNGHDMTAPKALLVTADAKIALADSAIQALSSYVAPVVTTNSTVSAEASTTVNLDKPRALVNAAIMAVNDARKALGEVIVSIAHNVGLKVGIDGKIEATTTTQ